jgi:CheY-like chemotaxis protein
VAVPDSCPKTILVIDDDPLFREGLAIILEREGYRVVLAEDGGQAVERLRASPPPDLIILDMMLPVEDGWRLLARRRRDPDLAAIPALVVTAIGVASAEWAADLGASGYLRKPVEIDTLLAEVRRWCG